MITELLVEPCCSQDTWSAILVWMLWDCILVGEDTAALPALPSPRLMVDVDVSWIFHNFMCRRV